MTTKSYDPIPPDFLVIGYGNELRCDDGVGARVAAAVAEWNLDGVRSLVCHQLTPELADPIASARRVIFVDAAVDSSTSVQLRSIEPVNSVQIMAHAANPRSLLGLAKQIYDRCPPAWSLTIPVEKLDYGEDLSPLAREGVQIALDKILEFVSKGEVPDSGP